MGRKTVAHYAAVFFAPVAAMRAGEAARTPLGTADGSRIHRLNSSFFQWHLAPVDTLLAVKKVVLVRSAASEREVLAAPCILVVVEYRMFTSTEALGRL